MIFSIESLYVRSFIFCIENIILHFRFIFSFTSFSLVSPIWGHSINHRYFLFIRTILIRMLTHVHFLIAYIAQYEAKIESVRIGARRSDTFMSAKLYSFKFFNYRKSSWFRMCDRVYSIKRLVPLWAIYKKDRL